MLGDDSDFTKYLFRQGSGFLTDKLGVWNITACRIHENGCLYLPSMPPSTQALESHFKSLKAKIAMRKGCSKDYLVGKVIPDLLIILGDMSLSKISQRSEYVTSDQIGPSSIILTTGQHSVMAKPKPETATYPGKYGVGTRVFVNHPDFAVMDISKNRMKIYLNCIKGNSNMDSCESLGSIAKKYFPLCCATKQRVFVDGKARLMWVGASKEFVYRGHDVASLVGAHLDGVVDIKVLGKRLEPTNPRGRPAPNTQPPPGQLVDSLSGLPLQSVAGCGRSQPKRRNKSKRKRRARVFESGKEHIGVKMLKYFDADPNYGTKRGWYVGTITNAFSNTDGHLTYQVSYTGCKRGQYIEASSPLEVGQGIEIYKKWGSEYDDAALMVVMSENV